MGLQLTKEELRAAFAKLRTCLTEGLEDVEIMERLNLDWEEVVDLKRRFYDHEAEVLRARSTEQAFVRYALEQRQCVNDLEKVIRECTEKKNAASRVAAVRAKSDILDRTARMGLELGLLKRIAAGSGLEAGQALKEMPNSELRSYILAEINVFNQVRIQCGEGSILDIAPGPLHRSPSQKAKFPVKGHSRSKVFGGRRVTKEDS
jgi:hypothetical protein